VKALQIFLITCTFVFFPFFLSAEEKTESSIHVGVAENQYDHIEKILKDFKIPYTMVKYRDLEKESLYSQFDVLFIPCGAEPPLTSSVNIMSRGTHLEGVTLNDQYYKIDMDQTGKYLRKFIENGGSAYFSDFSFRYLQNAFSPFSFFKDFPYIGLAGPLKIEPKGELFSFMQGSLNIEMSHLGWVVPSEVRSSEALLSAQCDTPLGEKTAPIASLLNRHEGVALFTSYHNDNDPFGIMRYFVMRIVYARYIIKADNYVKRWEQTPLSVLVDESLTGETFRQYRIKVKKGGSYLYFHPEGGNWQLDIFDSKGSFLFTKENINKEFSHYIDSKIEADAYVKIIPLDKDRFHIYTITTASGFRIFPYYLRIFLGSIGIILLFLYLRFLKRQRFKGRVREYEQKETQE